MHDIGKLISFIKTCRPAHRRWKAVQVLIIDEGEPTTTTTHSSSHSARAAWRLSRLTCRYPSLVSMVDGQLFDTLAALAAELRRKTSKPFGGIQVGPTTSASLSHHQHRYLDPAGASFSQQPRNGFTLTTGLSTKAGRHGRLLPAATRHAGREGRVLCLSELGLGGMHRAHRHAHAGLSTKGQS